MPSQFRLAATAAAIAELPRILAAVADNDLPVEHRAIARDLRRVVALVAAEAVPTTDRRLAVDAAVRLVAGVEALQSPSGLFAGGDNLESPPDTSFSIGDLCDTVTIIEGTAHLSDGDELAGVAASIREVLARAAPSLQTGGVHTPNHRWELSAALAKIHALMPDPALVERIDEWLAEGIDIDACGLYSERSPNYAAHVTNPALIAIARLLGRPELFEPVMRNLTATLDLIRADATVETVQSRRQDQGRRFALGDYCTAYRIAAAVTGRSEFAAAARLADGAGTLDPDLLAEILLDDRIDVDLPAVVEIARPERAELPTIGMTVLRTDSVEAVVYGGSDYPTHRRIRSGLACDPTFLRVFAGSVVLDSVRLSRRFFDLGPFRASSVTNREDGAVVLEESVEAAYYGPLQQADRRSDGTYRLEDDGRFSASMAFRDRPRTTTRLTTRITVLPTVSGLDLEIDTAGAEVPLALELAFRPDVEIDGARSEEAGRWLVAEGTASIRSGSDLVHVGPSGSATTELFYEPGEDYAFLGGTDAVGGERLYIAFRSPGQQRLSIRTERGRA